MHLLAIQAPGTRDLVRKVAAHPALVAEAEALSESCARLWRGIPERLSGAEWVARVRVAEGCALALAAARSLILSDEC